MPVCWSPHTLHKLICCSKWFWGVQPLWVSSPPWHSMGWRLGSPALLPMGIQVCRDLPALEGLSHPTLHSGLAVGMESPLEPPACAHRPRPPSTPYRLGITDLPMESTRACP